MVKCPIFDAVHEAAVDLYGLGFIDKRKMHQFDVHCALAAPQPPAFFIS